MGKDLSGTKGKPAGVSTMDVGGPHGHFPGKCNRCRKRKELWRTTRGDFCKACIKILNDDKKTSGPDFNNAT